MNKMMKKELVLAFSFPFLLAACNSTPEKETKADDAFKGAISKPLVTDIYTADPSAHVFNGKIYIYPSHDIESNVTEDDSGAHFDMKDYHVLSMDSLGGAVTDRKSVV